MGAGANWRGRGPGRIEAAADRGAYLRGIDARHLRSGDPRRRRLGRRRRAPANPHARRRELSLSRDWGRAGSPRPRLALARRRLGALAIAWVCGLMPRLFVKPPPRLRSYGRGVETNEDGDAEHWVYPSPAGGEVSFIRPFYRPTIFRIAPVVPAVFANWSVLPGMLVYANPS